MTKLQRPQNPFLETFKPLLDSYVKNLCGYSNFTDDDQKPFDVYELEPHASFFQACEKHVQEHRKPIHKKNIVSLVHPFYPQIIYSSRVSNQQEETIAAYNTRFLTFLSNLQQYKDIVDIILFDTPHCYALGGYPMLEKGVVNDVIFTQFNSGELLKPSDLLRHNDRNWFLGGAFNYRCYSEILGSVVQNWCDAQTKGNKPHAITDLVLNPFDPNDWEDYYITSALDPENIKFFFDDKSPEGGKLLYSFSDILCLNSTQVFGYLRRKQPQLQHL